MVDAEAVRSAAPDGAGSVITGSGRLAPWHKHNTIFVINPSKVRPDLQPPPPPTPAERRQHCTCAPVSSTLRAEGAGRLSLLADELTVRVSEPVVVKQGGTSEVRCALL
jgi:hypothetical protein